MAYYAKLDENNIVLRVESVADSDCLDENGIENEEVGRQFLENVHGWTTWKKCSYNTKDGVHYDIDNVASEDQSKALRKNFPSIGLKYDSTRDAFISPKVYDSHVLNETTCTWEPPVDYPSTDAPGRLEWDEANLRWTSYDESNQLSHIWNTSTSTWDVI
jgi:hypothetical protein